MAQSDISSVLVARATAFFLIGLRNAHAAIEAFQAVRDGLGPIGEEDRQFQETLVHAATLPPFDPSNPSIWVEAVKSQHQRLSSGINILAETTLRAVTAGGGILQTRYEAMLDEIGQVFAAHPSAETAQPGIVPANDASCGDTPTEAVLPKEALSSEVSGGGVSAA